MPETTEITFSNPRLSATIENWPFGSKRTTARFEVSPRTKRGVRIGRQTRNKTDTGWNKPKLTVYAHQACIVDGSDGKTYLLMRSKNFPMVTVEQGTMNYNHCTAHHPSELFDTLTALLSEAGGEA